MTRKKVLVVCMFDSIHASRWLSQFTDQEIDFTLFPSKKFKSIHSKLTDLLISDGDATYSIAHPIKIPRILGYLDFLFFVEIPKIFSRNYRLYYLRRILAKHSFDFVHALEIQGAGYLCDEAIVNKRFKFILTNWGSDIFYFQHLEEHLPRIKSALTKADLYSAECQRDYKLAVQFGFKGEQLPCIPNGGGLLTSETLGIGIPTSSRNNIVVKAYGGTFGRGSLAIEAVAKVMENKPEVTTYFYSVTDDLLAQVLELKNIFKSRVNYSTLKKPISHKELERIFSISKMYIGCSISDGISTSFLEALVKGVYPIQTDTSCASEWLIYGVNAELISIEEKNLYQIMLQVLDPKFEIDYKTIKNFEISKKLLDFHYIRDKALVFYQN